MADGHYVYVSCSKARRLEVAWLDGATGALSPVQSVALPGEGMPLAIAPDGRHLYAAMFGDGRDDKQPAIATFRVDERTGALTLAAIVSAPGRLSFVSVAGAGEVLLGASVAASLVASFRIDDDGVLRNAAHCVLPVRDGAHQITVAGDGGRVLVPNLGADVVQQFRFDAATGMIAEVGLPVLEGGPDYAPRHLDYHPNGRWAYLLNEKGGTIDQLVVADGALEYEATFPYQPAALEGEAWGAQTLVRPDGRFVYSSERNSSTVQAHAVDAGTGRLVMRGVWPVEACPRHFALTGDGTWLVVAGETSSHIGVHRLDGETGAVALPAAARLATGEGPVWVVCRASGAGT